MLNHEVDSIVVKNINALFVQSEIVSHRFVDGYLEDRTCKKQIKVIFCSSNYG